MKKLFAVLLIFTSFLSYSQDMKNEVKINLLSVIAFKWLDVSYQMNLNEESSVGISFLTRLTDKNTLEYNRAYSITPYYRYYLPSDDVSFFGEVFTKINGGDKEISKAIAATETTPAIDAKYEKYNDLAIGLGGGLRYVSSKGFTGEIYAGGGRNMFTENAPKFVPRLGVAIGYSFN